MRGMLLILKLLGATDWEGAGGRSRLLVAALLGMTSVEEGSEEPVGSR
jgi:hypothetical protein